MHETSLAPLIRTLAQRIQDLNTQHLTYLGIGPGQQRVFEQILETPGVTQAALVNRLHLDKSTISRSVKLLVAAGLVRPAPARRNQKSKPLFPRPIANIMGVEMKKVVQHDDQTLGLGFSTQECHRFRQFLLRALDNLERQPKTPSAGPLTSRPYR